MNISEKRMDRLIDLLNDAKRAQQAYADAHVTQDGDATSETLYEATHELCATLESIVATAVPALNGSVRFIDIDDVNAVAGHVWAHSPDEAERTVYEGVEGQAATVTAGDLQFSVGFDPGEDGLLWSVTADAGDGQRELVSMGGWAPGDRGTAESEIGAVLALLNGVSR